MIKRILFVDGDKEIRDVVTDYCASANIEGFNIHVVENFESACYLLESEKFNGIIIDALSPPSRNVVAFIKKARTMYPKISIIALIAFLDMFLDKKLKESLKLEEVSVVDKLKALKLENMKSLFELSCTRGHGEEL